jgi:hypothetical protein
MTQCELIIHALQNGGTISNTEAVENLGIARLASRVHDLKRMGFNIGSRWEEGLNRRGEKCRYRRYFLKKDEQQTEG